MCSNPRVMPFAKEAIDGNVKNGVLKLTPKFLKDLFCKVTADFSSSYHSLRSQGYPSSELMYCLLYGIPVQIGDPGVALGIRSSFFSNSLSYFGDKSKITLKSSIFGASAPSLSKETPPTKYSLAGELNFLFEIVLQWVEKEVQPNTAGGFVEDIAIQWLKIMLTAASENKIPKVGLK